jgi:hypothetical protein
MTEEKFEFISPAWIAAVGREVGQILADRDLAGVDFTICEELTDPPPNRPLTSVGTIGWYLRIRDEKIELGERPVDDADFRLIADYRTHHDLARRVWAGNPEAMTASKNLRQQATVEGRIRTEGDLSAAPPVVLDLILGLHDPVAAITE